MASVETDSTPATPSSETLSKPLDALSLSHSRSFDPWASNSRPISPIVKTDSLVTETFGSGSHSKPHVDEALLNEFDPLATDKEQQEAQQAWKDAESHPPPSQLPALPPKTEDTIPQSEFPPEVPPHSPSTPPPPPVLKLDNSPKSKFAPLSSIARTLSRAAQPSPPQARDVVQHAAEIPATPTLADTNASTSRNPNMTSTPPPTEASFDFQRFLDQMKAKSAEPVARYLRSFLSNFAKKTFTVNDQIKIIQDFLDFIALRMREYEPWRSSSDVEFENATEAMEKLVMNRLYEFTFTPLVAKTSHPITTDDLERDHVLSQRIKLFTWIEDKHLDVPSNSEGFVNFAAQELLKINHFKAPRDKLICILNCCKVIFGLIRHAHMDEGADAFVPVLIYVVLRTNPDHLISNMEYINRFRNPKKMQSEAGYYLSSLMGAVSFIETMDFNSLSNITQEEFESNVSEAVQRLASSEHSPASTPSPVSPSQSLSFTPAPHSGEESARPLSLSTPNFNTTRPFVPPSTPNFKLPQPAAIAEDTKRFLQRTGDTIQSLKPFEAIGKLFGEERDSDDGREQRTERHGWIGLPGPFAPLGLRESAQSGEDGVLQTPATGIQQQEEIRIGGYAPYKPRIRGSSPVGGGAYTPPYEGTPTRGPQSGLPHTSRPLALGPSQPRLPSHLQARPPLDTSQHPSRTPTPLLDIPTISSSIASIDAATAQRSSANMETLLQVFPNADREVVEMILEASDGDVGVSLERLLEMMSG